MTRALPPWHDRVDLGKDYRPPVGNVHSAEDDFWQAVLLGLHQPSLLDQLLGYCAAGLERLRLFITKEN